MLEKKDHTRVLFSMLAMGSSEALRWLSETVITHHLTKRQYFEMRGVWKSIEAFAYSDDRIRNCIIRNLKHPSAGFFADEKLRYKETATLSPEEIDQLTEVAMRLYKSSYFNTAYLGLILDSYLGFRVGELSCLRWEGVNWEWRNVRIWQSEETVYEVCADGRIRNNGYQAVNHLKKHHHERTVPLPTEAERVLRFIEKENKRSIKSLGGQTGK